MPVEESGAVWESRGGEADFSTTLLASARAASVEMTGSFLFGRGQATAKAPWLGRGL